MTLTSITALSSMDVEQLVDQDGTNQLASLTNVQGKLSSFSQEARLAADVGAMNFVVGANYSLDKSRELDQFQFPYTTSAFSSVPGFIADASDLDGRQRFETIAAFANVDVDLIDTITATGGIRLTEVNLDTVACSRAGNANSGAAYTALINSVRGRVGLPAIATIQAGQCVSINAQLTPGQRVDQLDQDNVSWRAGLNWQPAPQTLIYANVSRGYKSGSAPTIPAIEQSELAPVTQESVLAYEAGFKFPVVRRVLEATGAVFHYGYDDKQLQGRRPTVLGVLPGLVNVPKSRIRGAEFQLNAFPTRGLTLVAAGTYLDSRVTRDFNNFTILGLPANFRGNRFPYTPKWQLVGDVQYEFPVGGDLQGFVGANANYRTATNAGFGADPRLVIDAYTLVDARAGIRSRTDRWEVSLYVRNLTDEYYWTNVARLSDVIRRYTGEPRTYGIRFATRI